LEYHSIRSFPYHVRWQHLLWRWALVLPFNSSRAFKTWITSEFKFSYSVIILDVNCLSRVVISCHSDYKSEASTKTWQRVGFKQPQKSIENWSAISKGLRQIEPKHWSRYGALHVLAEVILEGFLSWNWLKRLFPSCAERMHLHSWNSILTSSM
jgi:hypothetical protein